MKVSVIIPAAGASTRYGGKVSKIFELLKGRAVFLRSLELFVNRDDVCQVQLVVSPEDEPTMRERFGGNLGFMGVSLVVGGADRTASVRNALANVSPEADLVCVHDGVRPCVSTVWIDEVFAAAAKSGAAILAVPLHGTLKRVDQGKITQTLDRGGLWEAQTPQIFRRELLIRAYEKAPASATDDAALVEALGESVTVVRGDVRNLKITTPHDLAVAAAVVDALPQPKPKRPRGPFDEAAW
jgi:2-C-methyl-D-erythritol 4-phosphate cytidylyltransferase